VKADEGGQDGLAGGRECAWMMASCQWRAASEGREAVDKERRTRSGKGEKSWPDASLDELSG